MGHRAGPAYRFEDTPPRMGMPDGMRARNVSLLLLAVPLGVGLGLGLVWLRTRAVTDLSLVWTDPVVSAAEIEPVVAEARARAAAGGLLRAPLSEVLVRRLMPQLDRGRVYDPYCYFRAESGVDRRVAWEEYPGGAYRAVTNSLGLRCDHEPLSPRPDLRVLVVGDSHTTGVCSNADCMPGRLEALLREELPERTVEVLNGSDGGYSFYNYLGVLERLRALDLTPDVLVVVVYGGNDFLGVGLWHFFEGTRAMQGAEVIGRRRAVAEEERFKRPMGQVANAVDYFRATGPDEVERALAMGRAVTREIERQCREAGIALLVAYLPSPSEVPEHADLSEVRACLAALGSSEADMRLLGEMGDRYVADVQELGIDVLDVRPAFRALEGELYWRKDLHLNLRGQDALARAALPWILDHAR